MLNGGAVGLITNAPLPSCMVPDRGWESEKLRSVAQSVKVTAVAELMVPRRNAVGCVLMAATTLWSMTSQVPTS